MSELSGFVSDYQAKMSKKSQKSAGWGGFWRFGQMWPFIAKMADSCGFQGEQAAAGLKLKRFIKSFQKPFDFTKKSTKNLPCNRW